MTTRITTALLLALSGVAGCAAETGAARTDPDASAAPAVAVSEAGSADLAPAPQQGPAREAADAYLAYTRTVRNAAQLDEVLVQLSTEALATFGGRPAPHEAAQMLGMIRTFMPTNIEIVGAAVQDDGSVELSATGTNEGTGATGVIDMVREAGAWKVRREQWQVRETVG
jgi:hypothetical protein